MLEETADADVVGDTSTVPGETGTAVTDETLPEVFGARVPPGSTLEFAPVVGLLLLGLSVVEATAGPVSPFPHPVPTTTVTASAAAPTPAEREYRHGREPGLGSIPSIETEGSQSPHLTLQGIVRQSMKLPAASGLPTFLRALCTREAARSEGTPTRDAPHGSAHHLARPLEPQGPSRDTRQSRCPKRAALVRLGPELARVEPSMRRRRGTRLTRLAPLGAARHDAQDVVLSVAHHEITPRCSIRVEVCGKSLGTRQM